MKRILLSIILAIIFPIVVMAENATWNASFRKNVAWAMINGKIYTDVVVFIESSRQGYEITYTSGWKAGQSEIVYPWVAIKIVDGTTKKKIYSNKLMRSCLYIFDEGSTIQIGQGNVTTEAKLKKNSNGEWVLTFDENGDL